MLVHTNEKPFVCPHCLFSCNNSANLTSHVRSVHKEKEFTTGRKEKAAKRAMLTKNVMKNKVAKKLQLTRYFLYSLIRFLYLGK